MSNHTATPANTIADARAVGEAGLTGGAATLDSCLDCAPTQLPPEPRLDLPAPEVADVVATAALIADRTRAGILRMLADGPHCVCELAAALGERQNNVSMHLARLRDAGLVRAVRHSGDARWMFYERDDARCAAAAAMVQELLG